MKTPRKTLVSVSALAITALTTTTIAVAQEAHNDAADSQQCGKVHMILANGTFDSSSNRDPNTDAGFFSHLYRQVQDANEGLVDNSGGVAQALKEDNEEDKATDTLGTTPSGQPDSELNISRSYVNYPATAGGVGAFWPGAAPTAENLSYRDSMNQGVESAEQQIKAVADACPDTELFLAGYSQGGEVVNNLARKIGAGEGAVPADRIAGVALFGTPTRTAAQPTQVLGSDAVGEGEVQQATSGLSDYPVPDGGGISFEKSGETDFGELEDRTVSWCLRGDIVCGMPVDSKMVRTVINAAQDFNIEDPVAGLKQMAEGLQQAVSLSDTTQAKPEDIDFGNNGFKLANSSVAQAGGDPLAVPENFNPLQRVVQVAMDTSAEFDSSGAAGGQPGTTNPNDVAGNVLNQIGDSITGGATGSPVAGTEVTKGIVPALTDLGGLALGATISTAKKALSPSNLAQIAMAGVTGGPQAAGAILLGKFSEAGLMLLKPENTSVFVRNGMKALETSGLTDSEIANLAVVLGTWQEQDEHTGYMNRAMMPDGRNAVQATADWVQAAAGTPQDSEDDSDTEGLSTVNGIGETAQAVNLDQDALESAVAEFAPAAAD